MNQLLDSALRYAEMGYPVFPCIEGNKAPLTTHGFRDGTTDASKIKAWWAKHPKANIGIATGGLLVIDVDGPDNPWPDDPGIREALSCCPVSLTPRGGSHYIFRKPADHSWKNTVGKIAPKVDTRADGGYIVVPPSIVDGISYRWANGVALGPPGQLPELPDRLRDLLCSLGGNGSRPGTRSAAQCDGAGVDSSVILEGQRNSTLASLAGTMRRAGMSRAEISAALLRANRDRCQPPLPSSEVERIAASIARYEPDQVTVAVAENHWAQDVENCEGSEGDSTAMINPGPLPVELLRAPGFISEVMDHCLETAPYPNVTMAFAGALALQATLAGRKVSDPGNVRTNIYLLGLAHSSAGKDRPRQLNVEIMHTVGFSGQIGGRFVSGEGIEDALFAEPCMLFQADEIDGMLQSINKSKEVRHESIMSTMLTMYSSSYSIFPMRRKAGKESPGEINQPCLVIFGTAIPNHYYEACSERMLTNGFFARTIVLESGPRPPGQEPRILALPERVRATAQWWAEFRPGIGNLKSWHPEPRIIPHADEALATLVETREEADFEYRKAEAVDDSVGTSVWGRVNENTRKLALIYAVSENHKQPEIGQAAAKWASRFSFHQAKRMLFMAQSHAADSPFHGQCLKVMQKLRNAPGKELSHSVLLKRMKMDAHSFNLLVNTLVQRGDIIVRSESTCGRTGKYYQLRGVARGQKGEKKGA